MRDLNTPPFALGWRFISGNQVDDASSNGPGNPGARPLEAERLETSTRPAGSTWP
jgi:hypothetical protein